MNPVTGLNIARIVIGALALVAPRLAAKGMNLDAASNPQLGYMARMFASREIALGAATLAAPPHLRTKVLAAGIAIDAADAAAGALAGAEGVVPKRVAAFLTLPALAAVAAGVVGIRR